MTLLVRDEEDLIRENIEYHLSRGVDFIIATDNLSIDRTPEILKDYERAGCLHYILEENDDYSQDLWVTRMARLAAEEFDADWVLHTDADEFWWPDADENLRTILERAAPEVDGFIVERSNFVTLKAADEGEFYQSMIFRERESMNALGRRLPPKVCHRARPDVEVAQGNHGFCLADKTANTLRLDSLIIWHFPLRNYAHFQHRVRQGGQAYARNQRLPAGAGATWRRLYERDQQGTLQEYYDENSFSREDIFEGLESGELIREEKFSNYMSELMSQLSGR